MVVVDSKSRDDGKDSGCSDDNVYNYTDGDSRYVVGSIDNCQ